MIIPLIISYKTNKALWYIILQWKKMADLEMPCHRFKEASKTKLFISSKGTCGSKHCITLYANLCDSFLTLPYVGRFFLLVSVAFFSMVTLRLLPAACWSAMSSRNSFLWDKATPAQKINLVGYHVWWKPFEFTQSFMLR